jgi:CRP-like cAMP-binding protein
LRQVDSANLSLLVEMTRERRFPKGATLSFPGEPVRAIHFIRDGEVAFVRDGIPTRRFTGGDIVGGVAALTRDPAGQHVIATKDSRTFEIDKDDMEDALEESFPLLYSALRGMMRGALAARLEIEGDAGFSEPILEPLRPAGDLGLVERVLFVRRLLTYGAGGVEAFADLARDMTEVRLAAGTLLWEQGEPARDSLLLYSGVVRCQTDRDQEFFLGPDSVVGGIDSIANEARWFRATAHTNIVAFPRTFSEPLLHAVEARFVDRGEHEQPEVPDDEGDATEGLPGLGAEARAGLTAGHCSIVTADAPLDGSRASRRRRARVVTSFARCVSSHHRIGSVSGSELSWARSSAPC